MGADYRFSNGRSLVAGLSCMMNMISEDVENHHEKVAYLAYRLAWEMGLPDESRRQALFGGLFHDIGIIMMEGKPDLHNAESHPAYMASAGAALLSYLPENTSLSEVVKNSQSALGHLKRLRSPQLIGQVVHLADVITLLLDNETPALNQIEKVRKCILDAPSEHFHRKTLDAFEALCGNEAVWLDLMYDPQAFLRFIPDDYHVTLEQVLKLSRFASIIIDYRSPFTAMHSAGVAATARELARVIGLSGDECMKMEIAGNLHDIGKLRVPNSILEKPGKLTDEEFNIVKEHAYYTFNILRRIDGFEEIAEWAGFHHEKLNGRGYPYHLCDSNISFGARIMAVADVFSAITEDRPYRKGMDREKVITIMRENAERGELSKTVVDVLLSNFDEIDSARDKASKLAGKRYYQSLEA